uniref:Copine C-terminal domain-containing protein n=1 Tax=Quercus lobata TaxID=97700 RepID=A0A7N2LM10_QUELO
MMMSVNDVAEMTSPRADINRCRFGVWIRQLARGAHEIWRRIVRWRMTVCVSSDGGQVSTRWSYPLSIVLVRVRDGPWEDMKNFGDELHARKCQNFQMVNLAEIMSTNATFTEKEIAFALTALMEIPYQYKEAVENGILGHVTGRAEQIISRPPPVPPICETSNSLARSHSITGACMPLDIHLIHMRRPSPSWERLYPLSMKTAKFLVLALVTRQLMIRKCLAFTVIIHLAMVLKQLCPATERLLETQNLLVGFLFIYLKADNFINFAPWPTSYAPVLLIIADGQVTRSSDISDKELSPQEEQILKSIVNARSYPLSIVVVRVADGPCEDMKNFGDELRACECHNFKMVDFTEIMSTNATSAEKEKTFVLVALMEIPFVALGKRPLHIKGKSFLISTSPCASLSDVGFHGLQDSLLGH